MTIYHQKEKIGLRILFTNLKEKNLKWNLNHQSPVKSLSLYKSVSLFAVIPNVELLDGFTI